MSLRRLLSLPSLLLALTVSALAATPGVTDHAPDFTLPTPGGDALQLSSLTLILVKITAEIVGGHGGGEDQSVLMGSIVTIY